MITAKRQNCGKKLDWSKQTHTWLLKVDGKLINLVLKASYFTLKRQILINNQLIFRGTAAPNAFNFKFSVGSSTLLLTQPQYFKFELFLNGIKLAGKQSIVQPLLIANDTARSNCQPTPNYTHPPLQLLLVPPLKSEAVPRPQLERAQGGILEQITKQSHPVIQIQNKKPAIIHIEEQQITPIKKLKEIPKMSASRDSAPPQASLRVQSTLKPPLALLEHSPLNNSNQQEDQSISLDKLIAQRKSQHINLQDFQQINFRTFGAKEDALQTQSMQAAVFEPVQRGASFKKRNIFKNKK